MFCITYVLSIRFSRSKIVCMKYYYYFFFYGLQKICPSSSYRYNVRLLCSIRSRSKIILCLALERIGKRSRSRAPLHIIFMPKYIAYIRVIIICNYIFYAASDVGNTGGNVMRNARITTAFVTSYRVYGI